MRKLFIVCLLMAACGGEEKQVEKELCFYLPQLSTVEGKLIENTCPKELVLDDFNYEQYVLNDYLECGIHWLSKKDLGEVLGCRANVSSDLITTKNEMKYETKYEYVCENFICYSLYSVRVCPKEK